MNIVQVVNCEQDGTPQCLFLLSNKMATEYGTPLDPHKRMLESSFVGESVAQHGTARIHTTACLLPLSHCDPSVLI